MESIELLSTVIGITLKLTKDPAKLINAINHPMKLLPDWVFSFMGFDATCVYIYYRKTGLFKGVFLNSMIS